MKRIILTLSIVAASFVVQAQSPPQLYQDLYSGNTTTEGILNLYFGIVHNNKLFFAVREPSGSCKLYTTDGNPSSTQEFKTITQYPNFFIYNDKVYFGYVDTTSGGAQLWQTDGTSIGTTLVKVVGGDAIAPHDFIEVNNKLFFLAATTPAPFINRLYVTDGTDAGTHIVDTTLWGLQNKQFEKLGNKLVFAASNNQDSTNVRELYITDGTAFGTTMVKDINPGSPGSNPRNFVPFNNKIFFQATTTNEGTEMWSTDGTAAGTTLLLDLNAGVASGLSAWSPKGAVYNGKLYFQGARTDVGTELFATDGTASGTVLVKDIVSGAAGADVKQFVSMANGLLFLANDGINGWEIWRTDGTASGTTILKNINAGDASGVYSLISENRLCNDKLYFDANDLDNVSLGSNIEPWVTDGTTAGTHKVAEIVPSASLGSLDYETYYTRLGEKVFFKANDSIHGNELYYFQDTCGNTTEIANISQAANFTIFPNPTSGQVNIQLNNNSPKTSIIMTNVLGVKVYETVVQRDFASISLQGVSAGVYFVTIIQNGQSATKKLLVQ